jgi:hypothetical protein
VRKKLTPFHWWIEFPEVFFEARPDPHCKRLQVDQFLSGRADHFPSVRSRATSTLIRSID